MPECVGNPSNFYAFPYFKKLTTCDSSPQTNGLVEHYNHTNLTRIRYHLARHQCDRDIYTNPWTHADSTQHIPCNKPIFFLCNTSTKAVSTVTINKLTEVLTGVSASTAQQYPRPELLHRVTVMKKLLADYWQKQRKATRKTLRYPSQGNWQLL